jgi:hypothetical protein
MFRALLPQTQEALHKSHLAYCVHVMSVGCTRILVADNWHNARNIPSAVCVAPPEYEEVMLETRRGP